MSGGERVGLAERLLEKAEHLPVRDLETIRAQMGDVGRDELARRLILGASRASAAVGAMAGAVIDAEEFAPPTWLAIPAELVVETLALAAIELKLIAELHQVYGRTVEGGPATRALALGRAWAERRGVRPADLLRGGAVGDMVGRRARAQVLRLVRRRLVRSLGRNLTSLAPLLIGAVAGAQLNRRATRALGEAVAADLARG